MLIHSNENNGCGWLRFVAVSSVLWICFEMSTCLLCKLALLLATCTAFHILEGNKAEVPMALAAVQLMLELELR